MQSLIDLYQFYITIRPEISWKEKMENEAIDEVIIEFLHEKGKLTTMDRETWLLKE